MTNKTCIRCCESKPVDQFHRHAKMKDGRLNKCASCVVECVREWRAKNPAAKKAQSAAERAKKGVPTWATWIAGVRENAIGRKASALNYARANKDKQAEWHKTDRDMHPEKYAVRSAALKQLKRAQRDPAFLAQNCALESKRRSAKLLRTPSWADHDAISGMYEVAQLFCQAGIRMEVDHAVPLQGKTVSGLHTHDNLQLLVKSVNAAKHNRHWPDQP